MDKLKNFMQKWDSIISSCEERGTFRSSCEEDGFFNGKYYNQPSEGDTRLLDNAMPEPYLGNPKKCGYVCLNLNPGH